MGNIANIFGMNFDNSYGGSGFWNAGGSLFDTSSWFPTKKSNNYNEYGKRSGYQTERYEDKRKINENNTKHYIQEMYGYDPEDLGFIVPDFWEFDDYEY